MSLHPYTHELFEGERRKIQINVAPSAGANSILSVEFAGDGLTFDTEAFSGRTATAYVEGAAANRNYICTLTYTLSSDETVVDDFVIEGKAPGYGYRQGR
jgi:hypothetical protein